VTSIRLAAFLALALVAVPAAQAARYLPLPSPLAALSASPPLLGGARAASEGILHRVDSRTAVRISVAPDGSVLGVMATQRLDVRRLGDYYFVIGAPVTDVEAGPGSAATPGLRSASILWEGFNPSRRTLVAVASLDPGRVLDSLPLRVETTPSTVTLVNATQVRIATSAAEAEKPPLVQFLQALRRSIEQGTTPLGGNALVTGKVASANVQVSAPLEVRGSIGGRVVRAVLGGSGRPLRATYPAGPLELTVRALPPNELTAVPAGASGRRLLARATLAALEVARGRQFDMFLGNPDPSGRNATTYRYVSGRRSATAAPAGPRGAGGTSWTRTLLLVAGALLAATVALVAWSRA
jgi:hypothetical protein